MNKQINWEDNIFIINTRIRLIADLLQLEADSALFFDKTFEDLDFVNFALNYVLDALQSNKRLNRHTIETDDLLYIIYETEMRLHSLLSDFRNEHGCFSLHNFPEIAEKITRLEQDQAARQKIIDEMMNAAGKEEGDPRVVSSMEINELLKGFDSVP
jgi:hypothetical protein